MKHVNKLVKASFAILSALATSCLSVSANGKDFQVDGSGRLFLDTSCSVSITPSQNGDISVDIDGSPQDAQKFNIERNRNTVSVTEVGDACRNSAVVGSHNNVIVDNNVVSINGRVFVNGQEIKREDDERNNASLSGKPPRIVIKAPEGSDLQAELSGSPSLTSTVEFNNAKLDLSGSTDVKDITARELSIDAHGHVDVEATIRGGAFNVDMAGSGNIEVRGNFKRVGVEVSDSGRIDTSGTVEEDYTIEAAGSARIAHHGLVRGHIEQETSGSAKITFGD